MQFYENQLFHIYNQGNNRQQVFFSEENYRFFIWKMRAYLPLYGDLIGWCLMPNHFHWQFFVRTLAIERKILREHLDKIEYQRRVQKYGKKAKTVDRAWTRNANPNSMIDLNQAIGELTKAYTRAINKEQDWTGSIWRSKCKAKDGWLDEFVTVSKNGETDFRFDEKNDYAYQCFHYIHQNPVKAGLVAKETDYEWSSAKDYADLRKGNLCNLALGRNLIDNI